MMENDLLSCKDPSNHGEKWLLLSAKEKAEKLPCYACCMLSLEDEQHLNLRKKVILSCYRNILQSNAEIIITVITTDDQVVLHLVQVLLGFLKSSDEQLIKLSGECLLLFLIHMKKEGLSLAVVQRLTVEIEEDRNYTQSLPHFHVLGRLLQIFPEVIYPSKCGKSKFLHALAEGLSYPSDDVKCEVLFLLRQIYQSVEKSKTAASTVNVTFGKRILLILKTSQNKYLLKNALGLLEIFISKVPQSMSAVFEIASDDISFTDVVKKIILSNELAFQVCIVQCICQLISQSLVEKQITLLLEANILEILFEALSTKNELLLESIFCCFLLFIRHSEDVTKRRCVFGVSVICDAAFLLLELKNWKLLCTAFNLLTTIVSSNQYLVTSTQVTFFLQSMHLCEKTFKIQNPTLLFAACKFFTEFLENKNLPWPFPLQQITNNVHLYMKSQSKFISTLTVTGRKKNPFGTSDSQPIELKLLNCSLDMIHSCIRICKEYDLNPVSIKSGFTQPNTHTLAETPCLQNESRPLLLLCLSSVDEIFIPRCLCLKTLDFGGIVWYHLIRVLSLVFDEIQDHLLLSHLAKKLIRAGFFKHLFEMKISKTPVNECNAEQLKIIYNQCINGLLKSFLKSQDKLETYLKSLEKGVSDLNGSLEDCASVLSQKTNFENTESNAFCMLSSQMAFVCLCYISFLNESCPVNIKVLIPHLIYFVTCNSDVLSFCNIVLKQLIFLMAVCTYECVSRNMKFLTGLMEANVIIWDALPKLKSPLEVYTHHKYLLWWCFKNETLNSFSSIVLFSWLSFCMNENGNLRHCAMKTVINLLCFSTIAQQTFVMLFDFSSSKSNESLILFLEDAVKMEISSTAIFKKSFFHLIVSMIQHLHSFLLKLFILKNEKDKGLNDQILYQGLKGLLWCCKQVDDFEIDQKIIFHVSKYCFLADFKRAKPLTASVKFLQYTVKQKKNSEKAWHVMTGDFNFSSFFHKCFFSHSDMEVEALYLLVGLCNCQVNQNLKSNKHIRILPNQVLQWLNSSKTRVSAYQLLNCVIKSEFQDDLLIFIPLIYEDFSSTSEQYTYYRLFSLYFQNAIILKNPQLQEVINGYLSFLNIISKTDKCLENHIMLQPWVKVLLETQLEILESSTWELFEKWLNFNEVNISLIGVVQQFANKVQKIEPVTEVQKNCIDKLYAGTYSSFVPKEIKETLKILNSSMVEIREEENSLLSQVETLVTDYLSNVNSGTSTTANGMLH